MVKLWCVNATALPLTTARGVTPGGDQMQRKSTARVPLRARDGYIRAYALIDVADAAWVNQWRWHLNSYGYVSRSEHVCYPQGCRVRTFKLHRELLRLAQGDVLEGDHISRDKLDNRRSNLRILTRDEQAQNKPSYGVSPYRGVTWDKGTGKWMARVHVAGKTEYLGLFTREEEAGKAARAARAQLLPYAVD